MRRSFTLLVTFVCLSLVGIALVGRLSVKLFPTQALPSMSVSFSLPGHAARVVEAEVTSRLEGILSRIEGVKGISSTSSDGHGSIGISFDKHTDIAHARYEASTLIRQVWSELPEGTTYPQIHVGHTEEQATGPFLTYTIHSQSSAAEIEHYVDEHIRPQLASIKGISNIELSGVHPTEWQLTYSQAQLQRLGITPEQLRADLSAQHETEVIGGVKIMSAQEEQSILGGATLAVRHVEATPQSYFRIDGQNAVYLNITAEKGANQLTVGQQVKEIMDQEFDQRTYRLNIQHDATERIATELHTTLWRTLLTLVILLLFVAVVSRDRRYVSLIACSMFVNLAIAVIFYWLFDLEIQVYSLAGIAVSLSLIIDNHIMMASHYKRERSLRIFLPMLAATLTTVGALAVVFLLDERQRLNLLDFSAVMIINLVVSLFVALFFVPAFVERYSPESLLNVNADAEGVSVATAAGLSAQRSSLSFFVDDKTSSTLYAKTLRFLRAHRGWVITLLILAFGLPVYMLPEQWYFREGQREEGFLYEAQKLYNKTLGSRTYNKHIRPTLDVALGGTLRLFAETIHGGSGGSTEMEPVLHVAASMPQGTTLEQTNSLLRQMETYLSREEGVRTFHTDVSAQRGHITIYFRDAYQRTDYPYTLKAKLISRGVELGGGSWHIYGLQDQGFSNSMQESAGSYRIKMYGYNYDALAVYADTLRSRLLANRRIPEVEINSSFHWWKEDYESYFFSLDHEALYRTGFSITTLHSLTSPMLGRDMHVTRLWTGDSYENVTLRAREADQLDIWNVMNTPLTSSNGIVKLASLGTLDRMQTNSSIAKENQQYRLCLQFDYIGSDKAARRNIDKQIDRLRAELPIGYTVQSESPFGWWGKEASRTYLLLGLVIVIIFFITGVLFNSLSTPGKVLLVIPVSFIGAFIALHALKLPFDHGCFAALVLLCGISVNAAIYLLDEYGRLAAASRSSHPLAAWQVACSHKLMPILSTILSTVLGFIPFLIEGRTAGFWYSLAVGTIGGLLMSLIGLLFILPLFVIPKATHTKKKANLNIQG